MLRRTLRVPLLFVPPCWIGILVLLGTAAAPVGAASEGLRPFALTLDGEHRFAAGDDPAWADPGLDDSGWQPILIPGAAGSQGLTPEHGMGWVRIRFTLPAQPSQTTRSTQRTWTPQVPLALGLGIVWGADEAYLNGRKIGGEGEFGGRPVLPYNVERVYPLAGEWLRDGAENIIALRIQNGIDAWGLVNGPVRIGERSVLEAERAEREHWIYVVDALLGVLSVGALAVWALFWLQRPRDRALLYLGAALIGLFYVSVAGSLPFYQAGLLDRWIYQAIPPVLTSSLPLSCIAWIVFVSGRRYRGLDLVPVAMVAAAFAWFAHPSIGLNQVLTSLFIALCAGLAVVFLIEMGRAARRDPEDRVLLLTCGVAALLVGTAGTLISFEREPADWTMRYAIFPSYWTVPVFTLVGMTRRLFRTRARLVTLSAQVLSAQGEERRRLSRDLHDGVSQDLQAAKLGLQMASRGEFVEAKRGLKAAIGLVSQSIDALRAAAQDLRPLQDSRSLTESLSRYAEIVSARSGIPIDFEDLRRPQAPSEETDNPTAEHLYRIAQEAIGNALRHGGARRIRVRLENVGRRTVLQVLDDGVGFDLERANGGPQGLGLSTMRERAVLIGARYRIDSTDSGTCIEVSIETSSDSL